jgi:hypothetical protein
MVGVYPRRSTLADFRLPTSNFQPPTFRVSIPTVRRLLTRVGVSPATPEDLSQRCFEFSCNAYDYCEELVGLKGLPARVGHQLWDAASSVGANRAESRSAYSPLLASDRRAETLSEASLSTPRIQSVGFNLCDARQEAPREAGRLRESGLHPSDFRFFFISLHPSNRRLISFSKPRSFGS